MIRKAGPGDAPAIAAFLARHIESSMFLLGNLERHGVGDTVHPHGTHFFLRETGDGITGVFGCTNGGYLMCQLPGLTRTEAQTYAHLLRGYTLRGMTGAAAQVGLILDALPVAAGAWQMNRDEPLMTRDLAGLPDVTDSLRRPIAADQPLLERWIAAYAVDTGLATGKAARIEATLRAQAAINGDGVRLLMRDGGPVAMAGINARAGMAVQVGGVYVPPALRGQGLAGQAVAAYLADLGAEGVARAILFAASDAAQRAYARIGFAPVGAYRVAMLAQPLTLGSAA